MPGCAKADTEWQGVQDQVAWGACGFAGTSLGRSLFKQWAIPAIATDFLGFIIIGETHDGPNQGNKVLADELSVIGGSALEGILNGFTIKPLTGGAEASFIILFK